MSFLERERRGELEDAYGWIDEGEIMRFCEYTVCTWYLVLRVLVTTGGGERILWTMSWRVVFSDRDYVSTGICLF